MASVTIPSQNQTSGEEQLATPNGSPGSSTKTRETAGNPSRVDRAALGCVLVLLIAGFNCFNRLGEPDHPIWDESYYLTSTARFELNDAQFASHPPLGLMLIAGGDHLSQLNRKVDWLPIARVKKIAGKDVPSGFSFAGVRLASALFGTLAAVLFYILTLAIGFRPSRALLLTTPFLFDTALIAQFRAAQLDSFQLCFMLAALVSLAKMLRTERLAWMLCFGFACGLATMVRANAILLTLATLWPLWLSLRSMREAPVRALLSAIGRGATALLGFVLAIIVVFSVHVGVSHGHLPAGSPAAGADAPFIEPAYTDYIDGKAGLSPSVIWAAADGYRRYMTADLAGIGIGDQNGSSPWSWPLARGAIVYRWDSDGVSTSYVALVPNLASWLVSLIGIIATMVIAVRDVVRRRAHAPFILISAMLALWAAMMAANVALAEHRVMYLYHYFMPLVLGWAMAALLVRRLETRVTDRAVDRILGFTGGIVLANFLLLSPLALHRPLGSQGCTDRAWGLGLKCATQPASHLGALSPSLG